MATTGEGSRLCCTYVRSSGHDQLSAGCMLVSTDGEYFPCQRVLLILQLPVLAGLQMYSPTPKARMKRARSRFNFLLVAKSALRA